jgi:thiol-disulfide isomerase/thioredoxin
MNFILVTVTLLGLTALATAVGVVWRRSQGRVRVAHTETALSAQDLGVTAWGAGVTLLQFSTEFCSPCRMTHSVLDELARQRDGVTHVDIDLGLRPELARRFGIMQTPTTLILDGGGVVRSRIGGAARRDVVSSELDRLLVVA